MNLALRRRARVLYRTRHLRCKWVRAVAYLRKTTRRGWIFDELPKWGLRLVK